MVITAGSYIEFDCVKVYLNQTIDTDKLIYTDGTLHKNEKAFLYFLVENGLATLVRPNDNVITLYR